MKSILFTITFFSFGITFSQGINEQYNNLITNSETFKDYKVIKINELDSFWKTVLDSVNQQKQSIVSLNNEVANQSDKLLKQSTEIESLKNRISDLEEQTSSIEVVGLLTDKMLFKTLVFIISIAFIAAIGFLLFQLNLLLILLFLLFRFLRFQNACI